MPTNSGNFSNLLIISYWWLFTEYINEASLTCKNVIRGLLTFIIFLLLFIFTSSFIHFNSLGGVMELLILKSTRDQNRTIFTDKCNKKIYYKIFWVSEQIISLVSWKVLRRHLPKPQILCENHHSCHQCQFKYHRTETLGDVSHVE